MNGLPKRIRVLRTYLIAPTALAYLDENSALDDESGSGGSAAWMYSTRVFQVSTQDRRRFLVTALSLAARNHTIYAVSFKGARKIAPFPKEGAADAAPHG